MRADVMLALQKVAVFDTRFAASDAVHADVEARLRTLERFRFTLLGAASLVGGAAGVISALLTAHH